MRLRTKIIIAWGGLVVLLWAGTLWPVRRTIESNVARVADAAFTGTLRGLNATQDERVKRMQQASRLVMSIPELRALIAEDSIELSEDNRASLAERLDGLSQIVDASLVCVLDSRGHLIAQNRTPPSPWPTLQDLDEFLTGSTPARALVKGVLLGGGGGGADRRDTCGLWADRGRLYHVVGVPLVFTASGEQEAPDPDGALIIATVISDDLAMDLSASHNCQISFLAGSRIAASSLDQEGKLGLEREYARGGWEPDRPFETSLNGVAYRSCLDELTDPCSGTRIGSVLVQSSLTESRAVQANVADALLAILATGLLAASLGGYLISGAISRPVAELAAGVRRVAAGDLNLSLRARSRDELGEVSRAFNDMVSQLRSRRELQRLVEESQAASRAKSQFLANMSHEIRTPLNGVVGVSELLLRTSLDDRQRRYALLVRSSAAVLATLINDILDFSKIEAGKVELESVAFDPRVIVEESVELLASKAFQKGLEVACDVGDDLPTMLKGDPTRIRQVLINLVNNAIKFTEKGEIIVAARCESSGGSTVTLRFRITDTGIGIPADRRDRLFKSFSQVDASTTRRFGGTGLGLAISKQLAELMGGAIGVESEVGKGSTFWFTVRLTDQPPVGPAASDLSAPRAEGARVILVERHEATRRILVQRLKELGASVSAIADVHELGSALSGPQSFSHILLGDPEPSAAGLLSALVRGQPRGALKVFVLTRPGAEPEAAELSDRGIDGCFAKPIRRAELIEMLTGRSSHARPVAPQQARPSSSLPARVLLVDDNDINRLIVEEVLAEAGYRCDSVDNGLAACEAFTAGDGRYDLIIMDCQMPKMNGFEATRRIREFERAAPPGGRRIPIVALTANAGSGDRQQCLDAGMDGYCTKPIDSKRLLDTIQILLDGSSPRITQPTLSQVRPPEPPVALPQAPTESRGHIPIDYDSLLRRCSGKQSLANIVLDRLLAQMTESVEQLRLAASDPVALVRAAHKLKGAAGMSSAADLQLAAGQLEADGRSGDLSQVERDIAALVDQVRRCSQYIQERAAARQPTKAPSQSE